MRSEIPRSSAASHCVVPEGVEVRPKLKTSVKYCHAIVRDTRMQNRNSLIDGDSRAVHASSRVVLTVS